jgi:glyoxalase-like protein
VSRLPTLALDHVVVAAATLADGIAWCRSAFGFEPEAGGKHPLMGTHNRIFSIAGPRWPKAYFEIIAIDPVAPKPPHPRWFGLDEPWLQRAVAEGPRLITWVARCADVGAAATALRARGAEPGPAVAAERATPSGMLRWKITIRADGTLLGGGAVPTLIEWGGVHPSASLPSSGVTLRNVTLGGLAPSLAAWLGSVATIDAATVIPLRIALDGPRGPLELAASTLQEP